MKMTKTEFKKQVNVSSSWIVYITKTMEEARNLHKFALTQKEIMGGDWHYTVSTVPVNKDCRVPEFFHDHGYFATIIEHNNGDWEKPQKYELYIVE